jgi:hypothetical protein
VRIGGTTLWQSALKCLRVRRIAAALSKLAAHLGVAKYSLGSDIGNSYGDSKHIKRDELFNYGGTGSSSAYPQGTGVVLPAVAAQA